MENCKEWVDFSIKVSTAMHILSSPRLSPLSTPKGSRGWDPAELVFGAEQPLELSRSLSAFVLRYLTIRDLHWSNILLITESCSRLIA